VSAPQIVAPGMLVTLNGLGSSGDFPLSYRWTRVSGPPVTLSQNDSLTNQRKGYGLGLRFISPIGPIGFDLGFPTSPQEGEPKMRFHFSVGSNY
jgi:outer membrane protein assembly factor BamA